MAEYADWWPILEAMRDHLRAWPGLKSSQVQAGADAAVPESRKVRLLRGPGLPREHTNSGTGELTVWVECWEHTETVEPPDEGYARLAELEAVVLDGLKAFGQQKQTVAGMHLRATVTKSESDGDTFRPSIGSRFTVQVQWRKK